MYEKLHDEHAALKTKCEKLERSNGGMKSELENMRATRDNKNSTLRSDYDKLVVAYDKMKMELQRDLEDCEKCGGRHGLND